MIAIRNILFACLAIVLLVITLVASADAMPTNSLSGDALAKNRTALAQVESKLRALEIAIAEAKSNGVPTEMPEVTATTARQFLKWIDWDINHPDRLTECVSQWWVIQSRSNELATAIPGQEIADTVEILDRALVELTDAHRLRAVPDFSGTRLHHFNGHWFAGNRPGISWRPDLDA